MAKPFSLPPYVAVDGNGNPMVGALLNFYVTGTTTPKATYSDSGLTIPNANPVVADANGLFGPIYLAQDVDYKIVLTTSAGSVVATRDPLLIINTSVISHQGSMIIGNSSGADTELLIGAAGYSLKSNGTTAAWTAPNFTVQSFLSGSGTYTRPANCTAIRVRILAGGGAGGSTGGTTGPNGGAGATSSFGTFTAIGGGGGTGNASGTPTSSGGAGGTGGAGTALRIRGGGGGWGGITGIYRANGGGSATGSGAPTSVAAGAFNGPSAGANTGGGGSGSSSSGTTESASAGGGGEYAEFIILSPSASYSYVVGAGGTAAAGTGATSATGGAGGSGYVYVEEFYF